MIVAAVLAVASQRTFRMKLQGTNALPETATTRSHVLSACVTAKANGNSWQKDATPPLPKPTQQHHESNTTTTASEK